MKTLGLCFVLAAALIPLAAAQSVKTQPQSQSQSAMNLDDDAMNQLLEQDGSLKKLPESYPGLSVGRMLRSRPDSWAVVGTPDGLDLSAGDREPACGTMRTYRVKREAPGSDVVHPSGYTTCVPLARFRIQEAVPKLDSDPEE